MELSLQDKLRLIEFFEFLLDEEISKPLGQMNSEAVDNYIEILLDLQDKHVELSPEYIDKQVRKIFHPEEFAVPEAVKTNKKYFNKKKVWLVAACIAILVALFSIISVANDWNVFDFLSEKFGSVHSVPIGKEQEFNGITATHHGDSAIYPTVKDFLTTKEINVLYPAVLPNDIKTTDVMVYKENGCDVIVYSFNKPELYLHIYKNKSLIETEKNHSTDIQKINAITCYICEMRDVNSVQIKFEYNGDTYSINYSEKETLIEIIENLEVIKNEN